MSDEDKILYSWQQAADEQEKRLKEKNLRLFKDLIKALDEKNLVEIDSILKEVGQQNV